MGTTLHTLIFIHCPPCLTTRSRRRSRSSPSSPTLTPTTHPPRSRQHPASWVKDRLPPPPSQARTRCPRTPRQSSRSLSAVTSSGSVPRSSTRTKRSITPHTSLLRSAAAAIRGCVRARLSAGWGPTLRSGLLCFSAVLNHSQTTMTTMPDVLLYCNKQCSHILYSYT